MLLLSGPTEPPACLSQDINVCLKFPYIEDKWPGRAHPCPENSGTRGQEGVQNCTCNSGTRYENGEHEENNEFGWRCEECAAGSFCIAGHQISCQQHEWSTEGSSSRDHCICDPGFERVEGVCEMSCVAEPGSFCEVVGEQPVRGVKHQVTECPQGYYCPGGRGSNKVRTRLGDVSHPSRSGVFEHGVNFATNRQQISSHLVRVYRWFV